MRKIIIFSALLILFSPAQSFCQKEIENEECLACHDNIDARDYEMSVHASNLCTSCHSDIREIPHPEKPVSPNNPASRVYRYNVPATCGECHGDVYETYSRSIHGKESAAGNRGAPVCTDCHGEHDVRSHKDPMSPVYASMIARKTCGQCHASEKIITKYKLPEDKLNSYLESYHGLASKFGVTTTANCASCHGVHNILPASDPDSDVNKKNLPKTCGKCHPNAGSQMAKGSVHLAPSAKQDQAVFYVTWLYILLIAATIGGMLAHNALDFLAALRVHYRKHRSDAKYIRFTLGERLQHIGLVVSFIVLAYTGFALRYRNAWWAAPFTVWSPGFDWRGIVHRVMAVVFVVLVICHVCYILFTARGKKQLNAMMVRWRDFTDFFGTMAYYFGIHKEKPKYARYNYIEKSEYWALVWGSIVMIATGTVLTFENFFFQFLPKWVFDVVRTIHYFEALLAVLAIVVWHIYFNVLHPDHYPINLSMTTGKVSEEDHREDGDIEDSGGKNG